MQLWLDVQSLRLYHSKSSPIGLEYNACFINILTVCMDTANCIWSDPTIRALEAAAVERCAQHRHVRHDNNLL